MADDDRYDLLGRLLFPESEEDWEEARAVHDAQPREPGTAKVMFNGPPRSFDVMLECDKCGKVVHGTGISFGALPPCPDHPDVEHCELIHMHWSEDCPAWSCRWWRLKENTWGRLERRRLARKWRRRREAERADPAAWADYWRDGGA